MSEGEGEVGGVEGAFDVVCCFALPQAPIDAELQPPDQASAVGVFAGEAAEAASSRSIAWPVVRGLINQVNGSE